MISKVKISYSTWAYRFLLLFCSQISLAQTHSFIHYSIPEGLPSSEVYDVYQDKTGLIWFATDNGVVRYDGNSMETFQVNEGLTDPVVFGIVEDSKGRIWFRTFSGKISYFFNGKINSYQFNDTLSRMCRDTYLHSLYIDSGDTIWFGTSLYLGKIDPAGRIQKEIVEPNQLSLKKIEGRFITANWGPAKMPDKIKVDDHNFQLHLPNEIPTHPIVCTIRWKGEEYFSKGTTIFRINKKSIDPVFISKNQIINLAKDNRDRLWISSLQNGVQGYGSFNDIKPVNFSFLDSMSVSKMLQDSRGGYWICTLQNGVYYIPEFNFTNQNISFHSKIKTVAYNASETFIGDDSGLVSILDQSGTIKYQKRFNESSILAIFISSKDNIWISTNNETYVLDHSLKIKRRIPISLSSISGDSKGFIWGTSGRKIFSFSAAGNIIIKFLNENSRFIYLEENNLFLFGRLGLDVFTHSFDQVKIPKVFENLKVSKVLGLNNTYILVTTLGSGFFVVNKNDWSYQHYDSKRNFIADNVYSAIVVDSTLWMGTEKGLAATKVQPLLLHSPSFQFYTKRNGLANNRVAHLSYSRSNIYAFYDDSFSLLPASLPNKKQDIPTFYLKDVLINNQVDSLEALHKLKFDQNNIQINFGFIDFRNQNILIRYRLSSLSSWNYATERNVKFFSLSPGDYSFELEYSTDNFHWVSALKHPLVISPQWMMNWRIQLASLLAISLLGFLYYKRRIHLLREKQDLLKIINEQQQKLIRAELETLESERGRIAKDLHDSIGTNLAAIKLFLNSFFKKSNEPNASIIEATLQETIQGTKDIIANLAPADLERFGLVEAIKIYAQRTKDQFEIDIDVNALGTEVRQPEISIHLFRIIQELLSNSLKYASAKKITISTNYTSTSLNIRYLDDGVGFNVNSISKGNGLLNIQSRVQILEGTIKFESGTNGVSYQIDVPLRTNQS